MSFLARTVSVTTLDAIRRDDRTPTDKELLEEVTLALQRHAFSESLEADNGVKVGVVNIYDRRCSDFSGSGFAAHPWIMFGIRCDARKVPAAALALEVEKRTEAYLGNNPTMNRVPKAVKEEIKNSAHADLIKGTPPTPSVVNVLWNVTDKFVMIDSSSPNSVDLVTTFFASVFNVTLAIEPPIRRAMRLVDTPETQQQLEAIAELNGSSGNSRFEDIDSNEGLFGAFLEWLTYRTYAEDASYVSSKHGRFQVIADERFALAGAGQGGPQKVSISGVQDGARELRAALNDGKQLTQARIKVESDEGHWQVTLDAKTLQLKTAKLMPFLPEDVEFGDNIKESISSHLCRVADVKVLQEHIDAALMDFIKTRTSPNWGETVGNIHQWCD